jgi:hypothetical protein
VDCTNIIWILASNALDSVIVEFSKSDEALAANAEIDVTSIISRLQTLLSKALKPKFGVSFS